MKFKYVTVNDDGELVGTNDKELALRLSDEDGLIVFDVTTGKSLDQTPLEIEEAKDTREPYEDESED